MENKKVIAVVGSVTALLAGVMLFFQVRRKPKINFELPISNSTGLPEYSLVPTSAGAFNNPGNVKKSSTNYVGEIELPGSKYTSFQSMAHGYRAMIQILRHHYNQGAKTLRQLISIYAPDTENDVEAYVNFITNHFDIDPDSDIYFILFNPEILKVLAPMAIFEQGADFHPQQYDLTTAYSLLA